jgi:hypothetical protein
VTDELVIRRGYLAESTKAFAFKPREKMTPEIGIKRNRPQISLPQNLQNKKRIQKMLEKASCSLPTRIEHDQQQRQRHLLSKRTRVSAGNAPKQECEKVGRGQEDAVCTSEQGSAN